ncbi:MAG TPA: transcriptional regulator, partial [Microlunatus sp.]|nr:transcriptional regulator [Microlunatus sp.]
EVLGRRSARFSHPGTTTELSLRHSEIVLLLAESTDGLSSAELGVALSDDDQATVTIRAELSRLRSQLGPVSLQSRPYRLPRLTSDVDDLRADLRQGRLRSAVARYRGPVLPASCAPGVERIRDDLHRQLRGRLLAGSDPDALLAFADTSYGRDDFDIWSRVLAVLPPSSSRLPEVTEHLAGLDLQLR